MSIEEAWTEYLSPGGKSVANRNRIVELMYRPLIDRLTETLNERYVDAMVSEAGVVLVREVDVALAPISVTDIITLIQKKGLPKLDCPSDRANPVRLAERGLIDVEEHCHFREREDWKTGPDSAVDDPTIRFRPYSASLITTEKRIEAARSKGFLVREPGE